MPIKFHYNGKEINLTANNTVIKSTNFSVDKNGNITAKGGTIGGFALETNKFNTTINGVYDFNVFDAKLALISSTYGINLSTNLFNLYNMDGNDEIDIFDAGEILSIALEKKNNTKKTTGTFEINTNNPKNFISVKHGNELAVSIGVGGINTSVLAVETMICTALNDTLNSPRILFNGQGGDIYADGEITARDISNTSLESIKKNIIKFHNALDIIKNSEIYEYNFKTEEDTDKKHIGFVIGEKYNTPSIVKSSNGKAIESYSMSSINWRGLQQILEIIENMDKRLLVLEGK